MSQRGELLATLCPARPARNLNTRPPAPEKNVLPRDQLVVWFLNLQNFLQVEQLFYECLKFHQIYKPSSTKYSIVMRSCTKSLQERQCSQNVLLSTNFSLFQYKLYYRFWTLHIIPRENSLICHLFSSVARGGRQSSPPNPVDLLAKTQNKINTTLLALLRLSFALERNKKWFKATFKAYT